MNKLDIDEEAQAFLEELCVSSPVDCLCFKVLDNLKKTYHDNSIRQAAARACRSIISKYNERSGEFFDKIIESYQSAYQKSEPKFDDLGRKKINPLKDAYSDHRLSLAAILVQCIPFASTKSVNKLVQFFVPGALSDRNTGVQETMLESAIVLVNEHGKKRTQFIMSTLQTCLAKTPKTLENDNLRKNVIILLGTMAKHLEPTDDQVKAILGELIQALNTPSQVVQEAVSCCFPPLKDSYIKDAPNMLKELNKVLYEGSLYAQKKGAAYGIVGIAKGLGLPTIKQQINFMKKALHDSKTNKKIGALIGVEVFISILGRLFEPYLHTILPNLLLCYGDTVTAVREAAEAASKTIMSCLSATGVHIALPLLLKAIDEDAWRTKVGSIQLLASMGHCAPKQLSICLPKIVPKVIEVLGDSHMKVQEAAITALKQLCKVMQNPELSKMSQQISIALQDPSTQTHQCLVALTSIEFKHLIDAASLSLIMPVLDRGFKERSAETRKLAAQITGALHILTEHHVLNPYLTSVIKGVKTSILDPDPDVRAFTATALGSMVRGSSEVVVVELMPWLMSKLTCVDSQVDRSGAAHAIAEVVGGLGMSKLDSFMEQIILTIDDPRLEPHVKDGYLMLFIYFPIVIEEDFSPYIGLIIGPVLNGLAEDVEYVRDTAFLAGQRIVNTYAESAVELLLPQLEQGIFVENWRIRHSSVKLIGDLLYKVSGITGRAYSDFAAEDEISDGKTDDAIVSALGAEVRNRVLSGIYMCRSDVSKEVKHAALHIWKVLISNTPKTLRDILPTLFNILLTCLASGNEEKEQSAARTLADLVRKLGERVLPEILPILEAGLKSNKHDQRLGVCLALSEIIAATNKEMVPTFVPSLIPIIRRALHDQIFEVREAAARTFDHLHHCLGTKALDEVLPSLIKQLNDPMRSDATLDGIKHMMATKSNVILPYILPHLTDGNRINTKALAVLAPVAGAALARQMPKIIPAILSCLSKKLDTPDEQSEIDNCGRIILSANDRQGAQAVVENLVQTSKTQNLLLKRASVILLNVYCQQAQLLQMHICPVVRGLIMLYAEDNQLILEQAWEALSCLALNLDSNSCIEFFPDFRNGIRYAVTELRNKLGQSSGDITLPGLKSPKGFIALSMVYREVLTNGPPDRKELAANSLCEIINHSTIQSVEANTMKIAGMVIRILSECIIKDRHPANVIVALLETLLMLLTKVGIKMRPFLPQCEQTLRKLALDPHETIKRRANEAMSKLQGLKNVAAL